MTIFFLILLFFLPTYILCYELVDASRRGVVVSMFDGDDRCQSYINTALIYVKYKECFCHYYEMGVSFTEVNESCTRFTRIRNSSSVLVSTYLGNDCNSEPSEIEMKSNLCYFEFNSSISFVVMQGVLYEDYVERIDFLKIRDSKLHLFYSKPNCADGDGSVYGAVLKRRIPCTSRTESFCHHHYLPNSTNIGSRYEQCIFGKPVSGKLLTYIYVEERIDTEYIILSTIIIVVITLFILGFLFCVVVATKRSDLGVLVSNPAVVKPYTVNIPTTDVSQVSDLEYEMDIYDDQNFSSASTTSEGNSSVENSFQKKFEFSLDSETKLYIDEFRFVNYMFHHGVKKLHVWRDYKVLCFSEMGHVSGIDFSRSNKNEKKKKKRSSKYLYDTEDEDGMDQRIKITVLRKPERNIVGGRVLDDKRCLLMLVVRETDEDPNHFNLFVEIVLVDNKCENLIRVLARKKLSYHEYEYSEKEKPFVNILLLNSRGTSVLVAFNQKRRNNVLLDPYGILTLIKVLMPKNLKKKDSFGIMKMSTIGKFESWSLTSVHQLKKEPSYIIAVISSKFSDYRKIVKLNWYYPSENRIHFSSTAISKGYVQYVDSYYSKSLEEERILAVDRTGLLIYSVNGEIIRRINVLSSRIDTMMMSKKGSCRILHLKDDCFVVTIPKKKYLYTLDLSSKEIFPLVRAVKLKNKAKILDIAFCGKKIVCLSKYKVFVISVKGME